MTPEEAQKAYDEAVPVPLSEERIQAIVDYAVGRKPPVPLVATGTAEPSWFRLVMGQTFTHPLVRLVQQLKGK